MCSTRPQPRAGPAARSATKPANVKNKQTNHAGRCYRKIGPSVPSPIPALEPLAFMAADKAGRQNRVQRGGGSVGPALCRRGLCSGRELARRRLRRRRHGRGSARGSARGSTRRIARCGPRGGEGSPRRPARRLRRQHVDYLAQVGAYLRHRRARRWGGLPAFGEERAELRRPALLERRARPLS